MSQNNQQPEYIFEVSWEVCNKVGGIHTVVSTKALTLVKKFENNLILIGPDVLKDTQNPEFTEDKFLFRSWREEAHSKGLKFRIGRWNIAGNPVAILVDFTPLFTEKDDIFAKLYHRYGLDSLTGQWDYVEPTLFGYAAGRLIESFCDFHLSSSEKIIAQFHEWMTGTGILYLKEYFPQAATIFTTHATATGRSIAGNGLPLYSKLPEYNGDNIARNYNIIAKHSLEKIAAKESDCFTTVSQITSDECTQLLEKQPEVLTINGFEDSFVPGSDFDQKRKQAREKLFSVAAAITGTRPSEDSLLICTSGRYEYRNKGIDLFIKALEKVDKANEAKKEIIAFIMVPAGNTGHREDLLHRMDQQSSTPPGDIYTHYIAHPEQDPAIQEVRRAGLDNTSDRKVKIIFAPVYLNGADGIFNMQYYDVLIGFDLTIFPSYYEPWGYTPLESAAFHIPTITTSLAGFGRWAEANFQDNPGAYVIHRTDENHEEVVVKIADYINQFTTLDIKTIELKRQKAFDISRKALWSNLIKNYYSAFAIALSKISGRNHLISERAVIKGPSRPRLSSGYSNKPVWKKLLVQSEIPVGLDKLKELSNNIWWSWSHEANDLFGMINVELWEESDHNPVSMMSMLSFNDLQNLLSNQEFQNKLDTVYKKFTAYMKKKSDKKISIAYFCMEYGLASVIKLYSGGLGILAGDYLKEASDAGYNMTGIGLLYRYGYFRQGLSLRGDQLAHYKPQRFSYLPILPVRDTDGNWLKITLSLPGRTLYAKVWRINVGKVPLYLLDTDIEDNSEDDKLITSQLYGGDWENRLKQELLLGIGGIRLLEALGIKSDVYHCNEGHAAFAGLERLRKYIQDEKLSFNEAVEVVRSSSVFTTHTPVPAGHDSFTEDLIRTYTSYYADIFRISWEKLMGLGRVDENNHLEKFSMSNLAARLSQEVNGVSEIHGKVSREMFNPMWEGYGNDELHVSSVTNGVHYPTWTSREFQALYLKTFGAEFITDQSNSEHWKKIMDVEDKTIWNIHTAHKKTLVDFVKIKVREDLTGRHENPKMVLSSITPINDRALTIGFARRFATYKRAQLLFRNPERLAGILNNKERPVQFFFAGKAHPQDKAGQDLIRGIVEMSYRPEFLGKVIFLENYEMELASKLVQGVDVWLNTPTRPLEASGTSGIKAVMNGVLNLSVLDGWWAEGFREDAGWALPEKRTYDNDDFQNELDAETIYRILENEVIPEYFERNESDVPEKWVARMKSTIANIAPKFTMKRMIDEYESKFYNKLSARHAKLRENNYEAAKKLSSWKKRISVGWDSIEIKGMDVHDTFNKPLPVGEPFTARIELDLKEISPKDIGIEIVFAQKKGEHEIIRIIETNQLKMVKSDNRIVTFECSIPTKRAGVFEYGFRIFPVNPDLPHRQDFGLIKWI